MTLPIRLPALSIALLALTLAACSSRRPRDVASGEATLADTSTKGATLEGNPLHFGFNFGYRF